MVTKPDLKREAIADLESIKAQLEERLQFLNDKVDQIEGDLREPRLRRASDRSRGR